MCKKSIINFGLKLITFPFHVLTRLVRRGRGGYCFILVGAFSYLLSSLGYNVTLHRSLCGSLKDRLDLTWLKNVDPTLKKHCNHVVCIVHDIDNKSFIVDVGLGDGPPEPFELIGKLKTRTTSC